jgi:hypothetical protein
MTTPDGQSPGLTGDEKVETDKSGIDSRAGAVLTYTNYTGQTGNSRHITRREYGIIPLGAVTALRGMMGENPHHDHYDASTTAAERWEELRQSIAEGGIQKPIFLNVDYNKDPLVNEGNHRLEAARELELATVPVEIAY